MGKLIILDTEAKRAISIILTPEQDSILKEMNNDIARFIKENIVDAYHINYDKMTYVYGKSKSLKIEHYYGLKRLELL